MGFCLPYVSCVFLFLLVTASCVREPELTVVEGRLLQITADKVYLTTMEKHASVIDSAIVNKGNFRFGFDKETTPFRACIAYRNPAGNIEIVRFLPGNKRTEDSRINAKALEFFIVESGKTVLEGTGVGQAGGGVYASVLGGVENSLVFERLPVFDVDYDGLGVVDLTDEPTYRKSITVVNNIVDEYPHSYLLLERIAVNRWMYRKQDIAKILSKFDRNLMESGLGQGLLGYMERLADNYSPTEPITLVDGQGKFVSGYDRKKSLNMMIFSKSYIHDTELFLFYLKQQQGEFQNDNLYIVDIDLNEMHEWWQSKLKDADEKIWDQLHADRKETMQLIFDRYGATTSQLPWVIFTDNNGAVVGRIDGYDSETLSKCKDFIGEYFRQ